MGFGSFIKNLFGGGGGTDYAAIQLQQQQQEEARKDGLRKQIASLFEAPEAKAQFATEEESLANSLRDYYGTQLGQKFADTSKSLKFGAANSGGIGGSSYADNLSTVQRDNSLGGTRIAEAVDRALTSLRGSREQSRNQALSLVNSGGGAEAVSAATAGTQNAIQLAKSQQRESLFDDLFQNIAVGKSAMDAGSRNAAQAALFKSKTGSYFPSMPTDTGRVVQG